MADRAAPGLDPATRNALLQQFAVEQLLLGLALVDRFLLDVVVVPTPRIAQSVLALLREEIPERRGEGLRVRVVGPDPVAAASLDPLDPVALVASVLPPLLRPEAPTAGELTLTWVDASTARPEDDAAWTAVFQRLNERRNAVVEALPGPLVLVVPPRLEPVLAHEAPDTWSIRSGVQRVRLSDLETLDLLVDPERRPACGPVTRNAPRHMLMSLGIESESPVHFDDTMRAWVLAESVRDFLNRGDLDGAAALADNAVARAHAAVEAVPDGPEALRTLARALDQAEVVADIQGNRGQWRELVDERIKIIDRLAEKVPLDANLLTLRAEARRDAAGLSTGDEAESLAQGAVEDSRAAQSQRLRRNELHILATSLVALGFVRLHAGDHLRALVPLTEAIDLLNATGDSLGLSGKEGSDAAIRLRLLRANALSQAGRFEEATKDADDALQLAKTFLKQLPRSPAAVRLICDAWQCLADVHRARGDLARAMSSLDEARTATHDMLRSWPRSTIAARLRLKALGESARVAHELGDDTRARLLLDEAQPLTASLRTAAAEDEDVATALQDLAALRADLDREPPPSR